MKKLNILLFIQLFLIAEVVAQEKTITKSFDGVKNIRLSTDSGDGIVKKGSGNQVKVTLVYTYEEDEFNPVLEQSGDRLRLKEVFDGGSRSGKSTWTLEIPNGIDFNFNTGSGDFEVSGLEIELKSNLGSGDVNLNDIKGEFGVNVGSGDVEIDGAEGELKINTGSGDIRVVDTNGEVDLNAGSGKIRLEKTTGIFSVNVGSGDVDGNNLTLDGASSFNSGSGDVEVLLASVLDHDISVNSGSGDALLDFNGKNISGEIIMEANKRNGRIIAPFDFDKEEVIDRGGNSIMRKTVKLGSKDIRIKVSTGSGQAEIKK